MGHGPHQRAQFMGYRDHDLLAIFASCTEMPIASAEAHLGLPPDVLDRRGEQRWFWSTFHPHQQEFLAQMQDSFVAFGCGTAETVLLIPFGEFAPWLKEMNITEREDRFYWHVHIFQDGGRFLLARRKGAERIDLTRCLLPAVEKA